MLKISHISKTFNPGTIHEKKALNGVNLHLDDGDFVTIIGSNGAGKSTLFQALSHLYHMLNGKAELLEQKPRRCAGAETFHRDDLAV